MRNKNLKILCLFSFAIMFTSCKSQPIVAKQTQQTEISFSWWGNDSRNLYTLEAIEKFEELHPDIAVKCSYSEWSGYETRYKIQMLSATEADVMQINYGWLDQYSPDGTGYYDLYTLPEMHTEYFSEDVLQYGLRNQHLCAIPIAMNAETVYFNKTIYDQYHLPIPETWDDLFQAAEIMQKDGIFPVSAASKSAWLYLIAYAEQASGKTILTEDGKLNFSQKEIKLMFEFYQKLVQEKVLPQVDFYQRLDLDQEKYAGSIAWVSDAVNYFGKAIENGREIIAGEYTHTENTQAGNGWYAKPATMYAISKNTETPKEAAILLDYLLNSPEMAELQGIEKGIPLSSAVQDVLKEKNLLSGIQYEASQKMSGSSFGGLNPILENEELIDDFFAVANDFLYQVKDADTAADEFLNMFQTYC